MEDKKLYIIQNVGKLYMKFGIRSVTMDDVAAEFGVSKKTIYQFFSDKEDLVSQVIDYYLENPTVDLGESNKINAIDSMFNVREHVAYIFKFYNNNIEFELKKLYPALYRKVRDFKRERLYQNTIDNIAKGKEQGFYRQEVDAELVAKLQVGRMLFTMNPEFQVFEEHEVHSLPIFDKIMEYHMHAICTTKGVDYFKKKLKNVQNNETSN
jgi:AcrR family transcriptional regulator